MAHIFCVFSQLLLPECRSLFSSQCFHCVASTSFTSIHEACLVEDLTVLYHKHHHLKSTMTWQMQGKVQYSCLVYSCLVDCGHGDDVVLLHFVCVVISASKKVATWRFGYPHEDKLHTVTLYHSITGGKKVSDGYV